MKGRRYRASLLVLGVLGTALSMYTAVPGWGTFPRAFWLDGITLWPLLFLICWLLLGLAAGFRKNGATIAVSFGALYVGAVVGHLLAAGFQAQGGIDAQAFLGALTLGFADSGELRRLVGADPLWLRAAGVSTLISVVVVGGVAGYACRRFVSFFGQSTD